MKKKLATINLTSEVHAIVGGIAPSDTAKLVSMFAFEENGYFFNPNYQMDRWDGKYQFYSPANLTYIEILPYVVDAIKDMGYKIKVVDKRQPLDIDIGSVGNDYFEEYGWTLAKHQLKAINAVLKEHKGIIKVGTGGGKTLITAVLVDLYRKKGIRTIVIVPTKDLIEQTKQEIEQFGIEVGAYYQKEKNLKPDVVVSTWQSLGKNQRILNDFRAVIVDECHGSKASTLQKLLSSAAGRDIQIRIGLTGTLPDHDTDKLKVHCSLGQVVAEVRSSDLINEGWLAKLDLVMLGYKEDFKKEYEEFIAEEKKDPDSEYKNGS
jgi:superfamily II DNA or RNA helicase